MAEHDLIVRGGTVVDGTGSEGRTADVAVRDGIVTEVGRVEGTVRREIDADGALVLPGFVDIHSHYDGQATWDRSLAPSSWHGVTTVVMGNCGVGFAPVHDTDHERLVELMEGVEDIPGSALHEGLAWNWRSFGEYLDAVEAVPHDIDLAAQVPHGAIRLHVMGERAGAFEAADEGEIERMAALVAEGIEAGALGFSTSRTRNHKTSTGDFIPTLEAEATELVAIAHEVGRTGRGVLQVVSDFVDVDREFGMLRDMVAISGRPLSISVAASTVAPDRWRELLDQLSRANADGLAMTGQVAPRPVGILLGLELTLHPFVATATYAEVADLPLPERVAALSEPERRRRLLGEVDVGAARDKLGGRLVGRYDLLYELTDPPVYEFAPGSTIAERAAAAGVEPAELALDLLLAHGGEGMLYLPFLNWMDGSLDAVREMLVHPHTVPGLSDGGAHVGTICDASFPTTLLSWWGRDRPEGRIPLPFLVERHCRATARTVGLEDRGVLAPGYRADLNVVDFDRLAVGAPFLRHDLPAGGRRLLQDATGYRHTVVAGTEIRAEGESTGALPGRLVRGPRPRPVAGA